MATETIRILKGDVAYSTKMETRACPSCAIPYAAPESFFDARRKDGQTFYCPNGHSLSWHETEADRLEKKLKAAERERDHYQRDYEEARMDLADEKRKHAATKGQLTKTKKRIAGGVCPCCNRHFTDLERHMHGQHPGYVKTGEED
jgi:DNA repair exonuclease SbcCD ATPase subunit